MNKKFSFLILLIIAIILIVDRLLKVFLKERNTILNTGINLGLFRGSNSLVVAVSTILVIASIFLYSKAKLKLLKVGWALFGIGTFSNLIDRVLYGGVTDPLSISFFPKLFFNFADISVVIGVILILGVFKGEYISKRKG